MRKLFAGILLVLALPVLAELQLSDSEIAQANQIAANLTECGNNCGDLIEQLMAAGISLEVLAQAAAIAGTPEAIATVSNGVAAYIANTRRAAASADGAELSEEELAQLELEVAAAVAESMGILNTAMLNTGVITQEQVNAASANALAAAGVTLPTVSTATGGTPPSAPPLRTPVIITPTNNTATTGPDAPEPNAGETQPPVGSPT